VRHDRGDVAGADHADHHPRDQHHEIASALPGAFAKQGLAAHGRDEGKRRHQHPEEHPDHEADDLRYVH
jgi:hypothetical protein